MYVGNIFILCYTTNIHMSLLSLTYVVQKIPQHAAHIFFLWSAVRLDPCHHSDTVSKFIVSQWEHTSEKYIAIHMLPNFAPLITFLAQHIIVLYSLDKLKILDNI